MRISKRTVDALRPGQGRKISWDDSIKGFGVRALPSGQKTYVLDYRLRGRRRRMVLGTHGPMTAEAARQKAISTLADVGDEGSTPLKCSKPNVVRLACTSLPSSSWTSTCARNGSRALCASISS